MAQKNEPTRNILNRGTAMVEDAGTTFEVKLPEWMNLDNQALDDVNSLINVLGLDRVLALIHKGLVQAVIDVRTKARAKDKNGNSTGNPQAYEPSTLPRPGRSKAEKALEDMSPEQLQELLKRKGLA